jgi:hypothetical protein
MMSFLNVLQAVDGQAEALVAAATVSETGLGVVADKLMKNHFASLEVYKYSCHKIALQDIKRLAQAF